MEGGRSPRRMPKWMSDTSDDESSLHSNSSSKRRVSDEETDFKTLHTMLKQTIALKPDEELIIYEEEASDNEDIDVDPASGSAFHSNGQIIELVEANEQDIEAIGRENFHAPSDDIISTKPIIRIKKTRHVSMRRINKISVPATSVAETLHERFSEIQNKVLKRHISPYFQFINYFKWKKETGFNKLAAQLKAAQKLKNNAIRTSNAAGETPTCKTDTIAYKLAEINAGPPPDYEQYWKEQLEYWAREFRWFREDDREPISRDQLDREIEAYMAKRGFMPMDDKDVLDEELEQYMASRGLRREKKEELDNEIDEYMSARGEGTANQTPTNETDAKGWRKNIKTEAELDSELDTYMDIVNKVSGSTEEELDADLEKYIQGKGITPATGIEDVEMEDGTNSASGGWPKVSKPDDTSMTRRLTMAEKIKQLGKKKMKEQLSNQTLDEELESYMQKHSTNMTI